jgi:DNA polymerase V
LARLDPATVRRGWSVVLERTVRELQGQTCIGLDDAPEPKQQIACTRSFGHPVEAYAPLAEAVSEFASRAAKKLREQGSHAAQVLVFIRTSPFRQDPQYSRSMIVPMRRPSDDTPAIVAAALVGLKAIYQPGYRLAKAGVMLLDIQPASRVQLELDFEASTVQRDRSRLMQAMDSVNRRWGKGAITVGSGRVGQAPRSWGMKQERKTPGYTTEWDEMPVAKA